MTNGAKQDVLSGGPRKSGPFNVNVGRADGKGGLRREECDAQQNCAEGPAPSHEIPLVMGRLLGDAQQNCAEGPAPSHEIPLVMGRLLGEVEELFLTSANLKMRLAPALTPSMRPVEDATRACVGTELGGAVEDISARVELIRLDMIDTLERLQL